MKGFIAKSALTALLEKVWLASGNSIKRLDVKFAGTSAGIRFERQYGVLSATVILPAIDETSTVSQGFFNDLIGYVLHELGHAWFTDNEPWDDAVREHGKVLGGIVNALEDCREEDKVIRSGYADNARALFVQLANNVFKDGFDNTMIENVAAVIAVEGRRLNGYELIVPDQFSGCPWAEEIADALSDARVANNTADVVAVALVLWEKIKPQGEDEGKGSDGDEQEGEDGEPDDDGQDGQPDDGDDGDEGDDGQDGQDGDDGQDDDDSDKPSDKPSDKDGDEDGDKPSDEPSDKPSNEPDSDKDDEEGEAGGKGNGKGAIQNIDGADLIIEQAREVSEDNVFGLPLRGKVIIGNINWR